MKRRIGQVDLDTGEVLGEYVTAVTRKRRSPFGESWMASMLRGFGVFKQFKRVEDFRVLFALLEKLDYENRILINQADIAKELGMKPSNVAAAIKRLIEAGVIFKGPKAGIHNSYQLNPNYGWRGSTENHVKALDDFRNQKLKAVPSSDPSTGSNHDPK
jgi:hypothetical protein